MSVTQASNPDVRDVAPMTTAAVRVSRTPDDLAAAFPEFLPKVSVRVAELGGAIAGPPYARYHGMADGRFDVEIGAPIVAPIPTLRALAEVDPGEVGASSLPGGRVAVLTHVGPYASLGDSWRRGEAWLAEAGHRSSGPAWELYVDDPDLVAPDRLRTEITFPLE
jgi:effector-binding domain-containing protein